MDENRIVTRILCLAMLIWVAGLVLFYLFTASQPGDGPPPPSPDLTRKQLAGVSRKPPLQSQVPVFRDSTAGVTDSPQKRSAYSISSLSEITTTVTTTSTAETISTTISPAPKSPQPEFYETSKANGNLFSSQDIGEGVVIGNRGSKDDLRDFYRVRATGSRMILRLEPSSRGDEKRFMMTVFDEKQRSLGEHSGKTDSTITLRVTPRATYYIKLDLRHAPIESPRYKLHLNFE